MGKEGREQIVFTLNDQTVSVTEDPDRPLLDVLRDSLGQLGTKKGCDYEGVCGACTVIVDGKAVRSCRTPVGRVKGARVLTVEGVSDGDQLHPLQDAFLRNNAVQCGFCTPGMIMSAKALLDRQPEPSRDQVKKALAGNLCRCTGYNRIIDAVVHAGSILRGERSASTADITQLENNRRYSLDAEDTEKVTGKTKYAADIFHPDMVYASVIRSPYPSATIKSIDKEKALGIPGVLSVITEEDIPGVTSFNDKQGARQRSREDQTGLTERPVLAGQTVRMIGDPVAIVVAKTPELASKAADEVEVRYLPRDPLYDPAEALKNPSQHLYERGDVKTADAEQALQDSFHIVEATYSNPGRDHAAIEPEAVAANFDQDGRLVVVGPTHQPHICQAQIAEMLLIPPDQIRVIAPPLGGSFGSRHDLWPVLACSLSAHVLHKPVKLVFSRSEVFTATYKDHPFEIHYRLGSTKRGQFTGLWARAVGDEGPYGGTPTIAPFVAASGCGPYVWKGIDFEVQVVHTNGPNSGPMRGYGMPLGAFGLECSIDELAERLKIDPWDIRMRNAATQDTGASTGQEFDEPFGFEEVLKAIKPAWDRAKEWRDSARSCSDADKFYGVGIASSWYQFGKSGELKVPAAVELSADGEVFIYFTVQNSGQGFDLSFRRLVGQELSLSPHLIRSVNSDTDRTLDSQTFGACRSLYWVGGAVVESSRLLKEAMMDTASKLLEVKQSRIEIKNNRFYEAGTTNSISLREVALKRKAAKLPLLFKGVMDMEQGHPARFRPRYLGHFSVGAAVAEIELSPKRGNIDVVRLTVAQDVGKALNPLEVRGQIEGAAVMEIGAALFEEYKVNETDNFVQYRIPRSLDVGDIETILVEVAGNYGPQGAKGVGEAALGHVRAAILNALYDAIQVRFRRIPVTSQDIKRVFQNK